MGRSRRKYVCRDDIKIYWTKTCVFINLIRIRLILAPLDKNANKNESKTNLITRYCFKKNMWLPKRLYIAQKMRTLLPHKFFGDLEIHLIIKYPNRKEQKIYPTLKRSQNDGSRIGSETATQFRCPGFESRFVVDVSVGLCVVSPL